MAQAGNAPTSEDKNVSALVRERVEKGLNRREHALLDYTYKALSQLDGTGDPTITDASVTIDETLYGENGVWKSKDAHWHRVGNIWGSIFCS